MRERTAQSAAVALNITDKTALAVHEVSGEKTAPQENRQPSTCSQRGEGAGPGWAGPGGRGQGARGPLLQLPNLQPPVCKTEAPNG